jgi:uncharacterized protein (TIGR02246 family)
MVAETSNGRDEVAALFGDLIDAWNRCDAHGMAMLFAEDGEVTGFDGSMLTGAAEIESSMAAVFAHHRTPPYVAKVRSIRILGDGVALLRAVAGMTPPGADDLEPGLNAVQTLVAVSTGSVWRVVLFQTTPAAFHGRPEAVAALTRELREYASGQGRA